MTFKNIKTFVVAAFAAATLFSCSSDESFNNSKLYVNSTLHPNNILPKETIYVIGEDVNNNRFEIPLKITSPISKDLKGTFSIDKDAIELFNAKHKTEYAVPNSEAIHWIQQSVTISSGKYTSDQPAVLEITNFDLLDKSLTYCLPIRITDTDKSLSISNNLNTMFFVFNVVQQDIYPVSVPYEGTEIDPENWIFEDLDNPGSNDLTNLVNGSFFGWSKSAYNCNFTIDLTQEYSLKSIRVEMHSMENIYKTARKLVCRARFYYTSSDKILAAIEEYTNSNPDIDPQEAALMATIEYVADFVAEQLTITTRV